NVASIRREQGSNQALGARQGSSLAGFQIKQFDLPLLGNRRSFSKCDHAAVAAEAWRHNVGGLINNTPTATIPPDEAKLIWLSRTRGNVDNLVSVRRPLRKLREGLRRGQLQLFATVNAAAPELTLRNGKVGDPFGVRREDHTNSRNSPTT